MEAISLKLDENLLQNMDQSINKYNFSTRTEFIRSAIRDKLDNLKKDELIEQFLKFKGKANKKISDSEYEKIRKIKAVKAINWVTLRSASKPAVLNFCARSFIIMQPRYLKQIFAVYSFDSH